LPVPEYPTVPRFHSPLIEPDVRICRIRLADGLSHTTTFTRDVLNQVTAVTDPNSHTATSTLNAMGLTCPRVACPWYPANRNEPRCSPRPYGGAKPCRSPAKGRAARQGCHSHAPFR
jgi:hypothetical protein